VISRSPLKISIEEAQELVKDFFAQMPTVKAFIDECHQMVKKLGGVWNQFGRFRWIPGIQEIGNRGLYKQALRLSANTPIQGTASDMCWCAMSRVARMAKELELNALPYNIIHDSQAFDTAPTHWVDMVNLMYYQMVWKPYELHDWIICKPEAEFDVGAGWGHLIEMKINFDDAGRITNRYDMRGKPEYVGGVLEEIMNGGDKFDVVVNGPHPNSEEAKLGMWQAVIDVEPVKEPRCRVVGRGLEIYEDGKVVDLLGTREMLHA
jgi:hypothetical protein